MEGHDMVMLYLWGAAIIVGLIVFIIGMASKDKKQATDSALFFMGCLTPFGMVFTMLGLLVGFCALVILMWNYIVKDFK